jgi:multiple sugar transport system substrate-binding protein
MSGSTYRPAPSPSKVGFAMSRRSLLAGAAGAAGLVGVTSLLAACGDDDGDGGTATTSGGSDTTAGGATGTLTFGSNYSDEKPKAAIAAMVGAFPNKGVSVTINTTDHNTYQENITTYLQQPDDIISWFAGYRMRFFADQGLVGDISDVWANLGGDLSDAFKIASTGNDGKQYFVPLYYYTWAVNHSKSLFEEKGYAIPKTWDDFLGLLDKMKTDGIAGLAGANDGKWPQMGMFDMINLRTNGYQFHVDLMAGKESWTDERVLEVFKNWETILPYYQEGTNGRTWQDAATALENKEAGMYLLGTFVASNYAEANVADLDFFAFPEINAEHGQDAVEAPIDGFMMAASPKNGAAAKEFLGYLGTAAAQEAYLAVDPSSVAASGKASTAGYNALQKKSAELAAQSKYIAQFLDRDTNPEFAANVMGDAIANFINDPSKIGDILKGVEEQKNVIFG